MRWGEVRHFPDGTRFSFLNSMNFINGLWFMGRISHWNVMMEREIDHTEAQAAFILNVSASTLRRLRKAGRVPYLRTLTGGVRYSDDQLVEIRRGMRVAATAGPLASVDRL